MKQKQHQAHQKSLNSKTKQWRHENDNDFDTVYFVFGDVSRHDARFTA